MRPGNAFPKMRDGGCATTGFAGCVEWRFAAKGQAGAFFLPGLFSAASDKSDWSDKSDGYCPTASREYSVGRTPHPDPLPIGWGEGSAPSLSCGLTVQ